MTFTELLATNPPRLVVLFQRDEGEPYNSGRFQWGIVGAMPIISLIGRVSSVISDLLTASYSTSDAQFDGPPPALVIAWDSALHDARDFVNTDVPCELLVGMLELVKAVLINSQIGQQTAAQMVEPQPRHARKQSNGLRRPPLILGPDGKPIM